jgi:hypothetical protein
VPTLCCTATNMHNDCCNCTGCQAPTVGRHRRVRWRLCPRSAPRNPSGLGVHFPPRRLPVAPLGASSRPRPHSGAGPAIRDAGGGVTGGAEDAPLDDARRPGVTEGVGDKHPLAADHYTIDCTSSPYRITLPHHPTASPYRFCSLSSFVNSMYRVSHV